MSNLLFDIRTLSYSRCICKKVTYLLILSIVNDLGTLPRSDKTRKRFMKSYMIE